MGFPVAQWERITCQCKRLGFNPWVGKIPCFYILYIQDVEGNASPLQLSCLENSMDRGAWRATVHGVTKESDMT